MHDILIGALDESMIDACNAAGTPCVLIQGGAISAELTSKSVATNLRSRPSLYPKMSVLKVGFYRELLSYGFNVWACDADAVLVGDPRPMMREPEWIDAHVAAATDCIDIPLDNRRPLLHCDLNTGLVFMRSTPKVRGSVAVLHFSGRAVLSATCLASDTWRMRWLQPCCFLHTVSRLPFPGRSPAGARLCAALARAHCLCKGA